MTAQYGDLAVESNDKGMLTTNPASELGRVGLVVGGKFRLESVIGRGGMGAVWSATHVNLGHRVAIKLVAREFIRSADALRRFEAEAKAAARLQSRHVVQIFDNGMLDDGTPYIAMELLSGENLEHRIRRQGALPLREAVDILAQACKALSRAHGAGIVHRDIKPDNIFLVRTTEDDADTVKLLDFGVAKMTQAAEGWSSSTGTGVLVGTPLYMSPEQIQGLKDIDHRTDLYSLGIVAFTMLSGKQAVGGESFGEIFLKICIEPLPSLRAVAPWLPPAVEAWFQRACARKPAERYQSAQEFSDALRTATGQAVPDLRATPPLQAPTMQSGGVHPVVPSLALQPIIPSLMRGASAPGLVQGAVTPDFAHGAPTPGFGQGSAAPGFVQSGAAPEFAQSGTTPEFAQSGASAGFGQSAAGANLAITAADIPKTSHAVAIAVAVLGGLAALGIGGFAVFASHSQGSSGAGASPATASSAPATTPTAAVVAVPTLALVDAGPTSSTLPASPRGAQPTVTGTAQPARPAAAVPRTSATAMPPRAPAVRPVEVGF